MTPCPICNTTDLQATCGACERSICIDGCCDMCARCGAAFCLLCQVRCWPMHQVVWATPDESICDNCISKTEAA